MSGGREGRDEAEPSRLTLLSTTFDDWPDNEGACGPASADITAGDGGAMSMLRWANWSSLFEASCPSSLTSFSPDQCKYITTSPTTILHFIATIVETGNRPG